MGSATEMRVGSRSSLNPNAEPFIPMAYRLVEDFSPLWWELVKTSRWFQDYWSTRHRFDDDDDEDEDLDDFEDDDDLWVSDGLGFGETQYVKEPLSLLDFCAYARKQRKGDIMDADTKEMLKKLSLCIPHSTGKERGSNPRGPASYYKNKQKQRIKYAAPKSVVRRIHQPR